MAAPSNNDSTPNLREFFETEEEYLKAVGDAKTHEEYIANQVKEMRLGAEKLEASIAAGRDARLAASRADEEATGRKRTVTESGSAIGSKVDGVSVKDFGAMKGNQMDEEKPEKKEEGGLARKPSGIWALNKKFHPKKGPDGGSGSGSGRSRGYSTAS